jgi:RNA polymerase sigma-70 factor, ECF subfamily
MGPGLRPWDSCIDPDRGGQKEANEESPMIESTTTWSAVAHEHVLAVWGAARKIAHNDDDAWDCVQEAFVTALAGPRIATLDDPLRWLCGVARNHARNQHRGLGRRLAALTRFSFRAPPPPAPPDPSTREVLSLALSRLPARHREAVVLRYLGGMTFAEVAAAQRCSEPAAKSRVRRGLARLRRVMGAATLVLLLVSSAEAGASSPEILLTEAATPPPGARGVLTRRPVQAGILVAGIVLLVTGFFLGMRPTEPVRDGAGERRASPRNPVEASSDADESWNVAEEPEPDLDLAVRGRVVSRAGMPIAGATVVLAGGNMRLALTDYGGRYEFSPPRTEGGLRLRAGLAGFRIAERGVDPAQAEQADIVLQGKRSLRVTGVLPTGEEVRGLRAAVVPWGPRATIPTGLRGVDLWPSSTWKAAPAGETAVALERLSDGPVGILVVTPDRTHIGLACAYPALGGEVVVKMTPTGRVTFPEGDHEAVYLTMTSPGPYRQIRTWRLPTPAVGPARCVLPAGAWFVMTTPVAVTGYRKATFTLPPGGDVTLGEFDPSCSRLVTLRVTDERTGAPITRIRTREAMPEAFLNTMPWKRHRSETGVFTIPDSPRIPSDAGSGRRGVTFVGAIGHELVAVPDDVLHSLDRVEVALPVGLDLSGILDGARSGDRIALYLHRHASGAVAHVALECRGEPWDMCEVDVDGRFRFDPLPEGEYFAMLIGERGVRAGLGPVTVEPSVRQLRLEAPMRVAVRISLGTDPSGLPTVPFLIARIGDVTGQWIVPSRFESAGATKFWIPACEYRVADPAARMVGIPYDRLPTFDVVSTWGGTRDLQVDPPRRVAIRVRVPEGLTEALGVTVVPEGFRTSLLELRPMGASGEAIVDVPGMGGPFHLRIAMRQPGVVGWWQLHDELIPPDRDRLEVGLALGRVRLRSEGETRHAFLIPSDGVGPDRACGGAVMLEGKEPAVRWLPAGSWIISHGWPSKERKNRPFEISPGAVTEIVID